MVEVHVRKELLEIYNYCVKYVMGIVINICISSHGTF